MAKQGAESKSDGLVRNSVWRGLATEWLRSPRAEYYDSGIATALISVLHMAGGRPGTLVELHVVVDAVPYLFEGLHQGLFDFVIGAAFVC